MVLKVYGRSLSPFTQVVSVTLNELGIPYEIVPVGGDGNPGYTSEEHLSRQPFGQVPVLEEEDGFLLYESRAVARYIVAKYGPDSGLIPVGDLKKLGLFEQAASVEQSNFHAPAMSYVVEKLGKPMQGAQCDEKRAAEYLETFEKNLKVYEVILSKQRYLAGDEITLVDLFHLPIGRVLVEHAGFTGLNATPNVARWWSDVSGRPSWRSILADPTTTLITTSKN